VAGFGEEFGACRCKPGKTMLFPREQADAHLLFEPGDLFGERRLRDPEPMRGAMKFSSSAAATKYRRCRSSTFPCRISNESVELVLRIDRGRTRFGGPDLYLAGPRAAHSVRIGID